MAKLPEHTVMVKLDTEQFQRQIEALSAGLKFTVETVQEASEPKDLTFWRKIRRKINRWLMK